MSADVNASPDVLGRRQYRNGEKVFRASDPAWQAAADNGLIGIRAAGSSNNRLVVSDTGHEFVSLCSSAYLGLNYHPKVVAGAIEALRESGTTGLMVSNTRIRHELLGRLEDELSDLFQAQVLTGVSCSALTFGILPLLASGNLAPGGPRVMVFDRFAHLSMAYVKPIVADEALVLTSPHNDLNFLEDVCRKYPSVAYVADGAYSMGGTADLAGLRNLQDRYGLFLYLDDSHSLSIEGVRGEGFVRSQMSLNPLTIVVSTLHKGFGASGGAAMLGRPEWFNILQRHAGPVGWSQNMEITSVGAALASAAIHRSPELGELQQQLQRNIEYFDRRLPTSFSGNGLPVRVIPIGESDAAIKASAELFRRGFYSSAVFFPIVPHGEAGLRVMIRADISEQELGRFVDNVKELTDAE
ncbi:aminotransferase class I/II-fold pyridoxal phosphate-dependent enzyme [Micromonospora peucetia]|uniref:aminotransferase class I/II-fold pyridoxal phosphate-dependent enzyme n=1 Tax=Micromonospora peucetia TaxID=47871 RepID=UPI00331CC570